MKRIDILILSENQITHEAEVETVKGYPLTVDLFGVQLDVAMHQTYRPRIGKMWVLTETRSGHQLCAFLCKKGELLDQFEKAKSKIKNKGFVIEQINQGIAKRNRLTDSAEQPYESKMN